MVQMRRHQIQKYAKEMGISGEPILASYLELFLVYTVRSSTFMSFASVPKWSMAQ